MNGNEKKMEGNERKWKQWATLRFINIMQGPTDLVDLVDLVVRGGYYSDVGITWHFSFSRCDLPFGLFLLVLSIVSLVSRFVDRFHKLPGMAIPESPRRDSPLCHPPWKRKMVGRKKHENRRQTIQTIRLFYLYVSYKFVCKQSGIPWKDIPGYQLGYGTSFLEYFFWNNFLKGWVYECACWNLKITVQTLNIPRNNEILE